MRTKDLVIGQTYAVRVRHKRSGVGKHLMPANWTVSEMLWTGEKMSKRVNGEPGFRQPVAVKPIDILDVFATWKAAQVKPGKFLSGRSDLSWKIHGGVLHGWGKSSGN